MIPRVLNIAVIGDEDLVNGMRLAGVTRFACIPDNDQERDEVARAISELLEDKDVALIAIQEKYAQYVRCFTEAITARNTVLPVIIEVPSRGTEPTGDAAKYYESYAKNCIGFGIQI
jgi:vacuolar-type H+-ATPase subunit F/Vma7